MSDKTPLVPHPCHESWDHFTPAERGHFCSVCETKVYDLSSMTKQEADAFLASRGAEDTCVSYRETPGGDVEYRRDNVVPLARLVRRLPAAAGFSLALAACTPAEDAKPTEPAAETPTDEAKPEPEPEPEPVTSEQPPEPEPEPEPEPTPIDERPHVKGKWVPADPPPETDPPPEEKRPTRKGKVAKPK